MISSKINMVPKKGNISSLTVIITLTKGELLCNLQDEPNRQGDVLHFQCSCCWGDLQVINDHWHDLDSYQICWLLFWLKCSSESHNFPSLLQISKKKMSATPLRLHLNCLRGEKQSIPNLIDFWHATIFLGLSYSNWIVLSPTGGGSQGMNRGLKLVSLLPECFKGFGFKVYGIFFTNNISSLDCDFFYYSNVLNLIFDVSW